MKKQCIFNWSGGKDSTLALHYALQNPDLEIKYLLTTVNDTYNRVSMHGVRESLLIAQAKSIGIPLYQIRLPEMPSMETYEQAMKQHLSKLKAEGITHSIFGDIFLEDLMNYRVSRLAEIGMEAIFPIWKRDTVELINEFIDTGFKTVVVCTREGLADFCGRVIDKAFIDDLPNNVDPCGENGEFHTFAFEGPIFKKPISFKLGEKVFRTFPSPKADTKTCIDGDEESTNTTTGYWYVDLL